MSGEGLSDVRRHELESIARKDTGLGMMLGFVFGPLGYLYMEQWKWAIINFITLNYLMLGFVIVPIHVYSIADRAQTILDVSAE